MSRGGRILQPWKQQQIQSTKKQKKTRTTFYKGDFKNCFQKRPRISHFSNTSCQVIAEVSEKGGEICTKWRKNDVESGTLGRTVFSVKMFVCILAFVQWKVQLWCRFSWLWRRIDPTCLLFLKVARTEESKTVINSGFNFWIHFGLSLFKKVELMYADIYRPSTNWVWRRLKA